jgi:hypothetical protein
MFVFLMLVSVVPAVATSSLLYYKFAKGIPSGRKWIFVSCLVFTTFAAMPLMPLLLMFVVPTAIASLLYCKLARWSGIGRIWMLVSCMVLAVSATQSSQGRRLFEYDDPQGQHHFVVGLWICVTLAQVLTPLAIGWWFLRRKRDPGQLQPAS